VAPAGFPSDAFGESFPVSLASVEAARLALADYLAGFAVSDRARNRIEVVLEEVVSNVVRHGQGADRIGLRAACADGVLRLLCEDNGPAFDPLAAAEPAPYASLAEATIGGQGIPLINRLTQSACYERSGPINRLELTFALT